MTPHGSLRIVRTSATGRRIADATVSRAKDTRSLDLADRNELTAKSRVEPSGWLGSSIPIRKEPS